MKKKNILMIGMPASGKSTIGVLLAKRLGYSFVDVDLVIQEKTGKLLKEIIAEEGDDGFLRVEEQANLELDVEKSVVAPGGSVIYEAKAMEHYKETATIVYLKLRYEDLESRLGNLVDRGVVLKDAAVTQTILHPQWRWFNGNIRNKTGCKSRAKIMCFDSYRCFTFDRLTIFIHHNNWE